MEKEYGVHAALVAGGEARAVHSPRPMYPHTPTPWAVETPLDSEVSIVEAGKPTFEWRFIASCALPDGDDDQDFTLREVFANANYIVRCVNAHEALVEALEQVMRPYGIYDHAMAKSAEPFQLEFMKVAAKIRAALSLATE